MKVYFVTSRRARFTNRGIMQKLWERFREEFCIVIMRDLHDQGDIVFRRRRDRNTKRLYIAVALWPALQTTLPKPDENGYAGFEFWTDSKQAEKVYARVDEVRMDSAERTDEYSDIHDRYSLVAVWAAHEAIRQIRMQLQVA
jgi:hypothetical protein